MLSEPHLRRRQGGATLIEVLISATLITVGMLSLAWLMAASGRYEKMAQFRGTAIHLANGLADRMRANAGAAGNYQRLEAYAPDTESTFATDCWTANCTAEQLADFDVAIVRNHARQLLPGGDLQVEIPAAGEAVIWLMWRDPEAVDTPDSAASLSRNCPPSIGAPDPVPQCLAVRVLL